VNGTKQPGQSDRDKLIGDKVTRYKVTGGQIDLDKLTGDKMAWTKGPGTKCRVTAAATVTNSKRKAKTKERREGTGKLVVMHEN
jgi:hypothetical protein